MINSSDEIYVIRCFEQYSSYIMHACKKAGFPCCSVRQHGLLGNKIPYVFFNSILQSYSILGRANAYTSVQHTHAKRSSVPLKLCTSLH